MLEHKTTLTGRAAYRMESNCGASTGMQNQALERDVLPSSLWETLHSVLFGISSVLELLIMSLPFYINLAWVFCHL